MWLFDQSSEPREVSLKNERCIQMTRLNETGKHDAHKLIIRCFTLPEHKQWMQDLTETYNTAVDLMSRNRKYNTCKVATSPALGLSNTTPSRTLPPQRQEYRYFIY